MIADANRNDHRGSAAPRLVCNALRDGDLAEAEQLLRMRLACEPRDVDAIAKLAALLIAGGKSGEAIIHLSRAIAIAPLELHFRLQLCQLYQRRGEFPLALSIIEQLPSEFRRTPFVRIPKAELVGLLGRRDEEITLYQDLLIDSPRDIRLWLSLGNALNYAGRPSEAVRALRRAIKLAPSSGEPWWALANLKSFRFDNRDITAMQRALRGNGASEDALHFHFALGKAFEDRNEHARSFDQYRQGNSIRASAYRPEQMRVTPFVDQAVATFSRPFFQHHGNSGCLARDPIFIVGLQRSGSTLIEQMLASHPQVEGTTELLAMQQIWDEVARMATRNGRHVFQHLSDLKPSAYRRIGEDYLERTAAFRLLGRPFFIDKLPANWLNVGLIRLALPNARIIDARRHPMACGFSNFKQLYAHGVTYAFSLPSIGDFYRDYLRLMNHFDEVQPGAILHVANERLIEDPEVELRRMLDYLDLPFDPACLDFHRNRRAVNTPSAEQVRRPINRDGVDAWRPYAQWLGPLEEKLGQALDEWLPSCLPSDSVNIPDDLAAGAAGRPDAIR